MNLRIYQMNVSKLLIVSLFTEKPDWKIKYILEITE